MEKKNMSQKGHSPQVIHSISKISITFFKEYINERN